MSRKMLRPFIVKVSVLGYFPLQIYIRRIVQCTYRYMHICTMYIVQCTMYNVHCKVYNRPVSSNQFLILHIKYNTYLYVSIICINHFSTLYTVYNVQITFVVPLIHLKMKHIQSFHIFIPEFVTVNMYAYTSIPIGIILFNRSNTSGRSTRTIGMLKKETWIRERYTHSVGPTLTL